MAHVLLVGGSPSTDSRSEAILDVVTPWLTARGHVVERLALRTLPADDLVFGRVAAPAIARSLEQLAQAEGVVLATPIYKAAYSGLLKLWLDLLPQLGLAGKAVLPLATGGTLAHVLAVDYALRPVLASMGPTHIGQAWFVLDKWLTRDVGGATVLIEGEDERLRRVVQSFADVLAALPQTK